MKKIGLFYGGTTAKTAVVALKIQEAFAENEVVLVAVPYCAAVCASALSR